MNHASPVPRIENSRYNTLRRRLDDAGCFRPAPWAYGVKIAAVVAAAALGYGGLLTNPDAAIRAGLILLVAFASVQAGFLAHDAGDGGITRNRLVAQGLRHFLMSFGSALSSSYFHYLHKIHHATLTRGDAQSGGEMFTVNPYEIRWLKKAVSWNGVVFTVATSCLRGLTFKLESLRYVFKNKRDTKVDRVFMAAHAIFWFALPLPFIGGVDAVINYGLVTLAAGPYVGTVLLLNHAGMSAPAPQERLSLLDRVSRTTRNLGSSRWSDFVFGGVNNHIEHHLFPKVPSPRLRQARTITRAFFRDHNIAYSETSFPRAAREAFQHLRAMPAPRRAAEALS